MPKVIRHFLFNASIVRSERSYRSQIIIIIIKMSKLFWDETIHPIRSYTFTVIFYRVLVGVCVCMCYVMRLSRRNNQNELHDAQMGTCIARMRSLPICVQNNSGNFAIRLVKDEFGFSLVLFAKCIATQAAVS